MPINEWVGQSPTRPRIGCFEAAGIALPLPVGSIDSAIGSFYSGFMLLMAESGPATVHNGADQIEVGSTLTPRSRKDNLALHGRQVPAALTDGSDTGRRILPKVRKRLFHPFLTTKEEVTGPRPAKAVPRGKKSS